MKEKGNEESSSCSGPSEYYPCKHVFALLKTYKNHPRSFLDLNLVMKKLSKKEKPELLSLTRKKVLASPSSLSRGRLTYPRGALRSYDLEV